MHYFYYVRLSFSSGLSFITLKSNCIDADWTLDVGSTCTPTIATLQIIHVILTLLRTRMQIDSLHICLRWYHWHVNHCKVMTATPWLGHGLITQYWNLVACNCYWVAFGRKGYLRCRSTCSQCTFWRIGMLDLFCWTTLNYCLADCNV